MRTRPLILATLLLVACVSPPEKPEQIALRTGFGMEVVKGKHFRHRVFRNHSAQPATTLHVYIEGDGIPYTSRYIIASDPTPRSPLMLRLMQRDPAPSVYVGRPCYFGLAQDTHCNPVYWTLGRFSKEVVESQAAVIRAEMQRAGATRVAIFGHSGGGALALLTAQQLQPHVERIVTIAGNLDIDAWTRAHRYTPLAASLNPVEQPPLDPPVPMIHLVGSRDRNIPPDLVSAAAAKIGGQVRVIEDFTHLCCWERRWPLP